MDFISSWINGIIIGVIINTIIELILPEGKNKKYIRTIMGIYISFIIISPIITKIRDKDISLNNVMRNYEVDNYSIQTSIDTNKYIEETYVAKIKQDMVDKLMQKKYEVIDSDVIIENEDNNTYGEILRISLNLRKIENNKVELVKKININSNNSQTEKKEISEAEKEELKEYLQSIYGTNKEDIEIYV